MKHITLLILIFVTLSCTPKHSNYTKKYDQRYRLVQVPIIVDQDTTYVNELRFLKISSAKNTQKLMYDRFGIWDKKLEGKHQENMSQMVWESRTLLNNDMQFLVIADGAETQQDYFSAVMVFDTNNDDCLSETHPLREVLIKFFANGMNNLSNDMSFYKLK